MTVFCMPVSAALFDLDGTLVDSLDDLTDAVNAMLSGFGKPLLSNVEVRKLIGKGARNLVQRALRTESQEEIDQGLGMFISFNSAHIADKSRLYPGAIDALDRLKEFGVRMAIISNKDEALSCLILKTMGISHYFEYICGGDSFPEMKPSPLPLLRVIEYFGLAPGQAIMVGDSINDIQAGGRAGIATIGCSWGYGAQGELLEADHVAYSCGEMADILLGLRK